MTEQLARASGIDVNHWDGHFSQVSNPPRPIDFVIQKLTEAVYKDVAYDSLKKEIVWVPIRGGFHYLRGPKMGSWKSQADVFLTYLTDEYHFWALDVEKRYNYAGTMINGNAGTSQKPTEGYVESIIPWLEYVVNDPRTKRRPGLLYTGPDVWNTWLKPHQELLSQYDLWVAHYWRTPNPSANPNYYTISGCSNMNRNWRFWQYDSRGQGGRGKEYGVESRDLDLDVFNGTVEELKAWALGSTTPPTQEPSLPILWREAGKHQWDLSGDSGSF